MAIDVTELGFGGAVVSDVEREQSILRRWAHNNAVRGREDLDDTLDGYIHCLRAQPRGGYNHPARRPEDEEEYEERAQSLRELREQIQHFTYHTDAEMSAAAAQMEELGQLVTGRVTVGATVEITGCEEWREAMFRLAGEALDEACPF